MTSFFSFFNHLFNTLQVKSDKSKLNQIKKLVVAIIENIVEIEENKGAKRFTFSLCL